MADTLLFDLAERLLEVAGAALDSPPTRSYVCIGDDLATDRCAHLAVFLSPNGLTQSIAAKARGSAQAPLPTTKTAIRVAQFTVSLLSTDCYPTHGDAANPPDPAAISAAAEAVYTDQWDLWTALRDEASAGTLFDGLLDHGRDGVAVDQPSSTFGPQGETAGFRVPLTVEIVRLPDVGS